MSYTSTINVNIKKVIALIVLNYQLSFSTGHNRYVFRKLLITFESTSTSCTFKCKNHNIPFI